MHGAYRSDLVALLGSILGHATVFGGLVLWNWGASSAPVERMVRPAMTVDLVSRPNGAAATPGSARAVATDPPPMVPAIVAPAPQAPPQIVTGAQVVATASPAASVATGASLPQAEVSALLADYQRRLYAIVARNSRYPAEARGQRLRGVTALAFRLDRQGQVVERWIQASSGSLLLDNAAIEALERAQPLPPIPAGLPAQLAFAVEIDASTVQSQAIVLSE